MSELILKYGVPAPFGSSLIGYFGYIKNGYTIDENGICTGIFVSNNQSDISVRLLAIDNKPTYNLNTINNPQQLLVMSEDNKYIFPYSPEYTYSSTPRFSDREPYNPIYSLISIIDAVKTNNISIPNAGDYINFMTSINNVNVPGLEITDPLIIVKKAIHIASSPTEDMINYKPAKYWSDIKAMLTVFSQIYGKDISDNCIFFSTSDITKIPKYLSLFDCRTPKSFNLMSFLSSKNFIYFSICCCCCICIIGIIISIVMMSSSKKKLRRKGGYYYF
jgi:hypothetical protein